MNTIENLLVFRCPCCEHLTTLYVEESPTFKYFICQNIDCEVQKIYDENTVVKMCDSVSK